LLIEVDNVGSVIVAPGYPEVKRTVGVSEVHHLVLCALSAGYKFLDGAEGFRENQVLIDRFCGRPDRRPTVPFDHVVILSANWTGEP
jgi:hypothetical protein